MRGKRGSMQEQKLRTPWILISIKCMLLLQLMASSMGWARIEKMLTVGLTLFMGL